VSPRLTWQVCRDLGEVKITLLEITLRHICQRIFVVKRMARSLLSRHPRDIVLGASNLWTTVMTLVVFKTGIPLPWVFLRLRWQLGLVA
jgi:hypothetical protein